MIICKFGGASVVNAEAIQNLGNIVKNIQGKKIIVVSAIGKTTSKLADVVLSKYQGNDKYISLLSKIKNEHFKILSELFTEDYKTVFSEVKNVFSKIEENLQNKNTKDYDYYYDQIVSFGEIISTKIVSKYLNDIGISNMWTDIRDYIKTDSSFRAAEIDIEISKSNIKNFFIDECYVTQGFIASDKNGNFTTLGLEGSDYSAAILANFLNAKKVILWKDVDGIYNVDPKQFDDAVILPELSYHQAIELSHSAKIIHPKTIQPIQAKNIPLFVKNFNNPDANGTVIR